MEDPEKPKFKLPQSLIVSKTPSMDLKDRNELNLETSPEQEKLVESSRNPPQYEQHALIRTELLPWEDEPTLVQEVPGILTTDQQISGKKMKPEDQLPLQLNGPNHKNEQSDLDVDQEESSIPKFILPTHMVGTIAKKYKPPSPAQEAAKKLKKLRVSLEGVVGGRVDARDYRGTSAPNGHWKTVSNYKMGAKGMVGFIYVIKNTVNNKFYIGKKNYVGRGKLNKGEPSNWPYYISSSTELSDDIKLYRKEGFEFYHVCDCYTLGGLSWAETFFLCWARVPENPDMFYNVLINVVKWRAKEHVTQQAIDRLKSILESKHE